MVGVRGVSGLGRGCDRSLPTQRKAPSIVNPMPTESTRVARFGRHIHKGQGYRLIAHSFLCTSLEFLL